MEGGSQMVFQERSYSVLVVSSAEKFNSAITTLLPAADYYPVHFAGSIAAAKRAVLEQTYDFVIINAPLPDELGTRFAIDICSDKSCVALLLVRSDIYEEVYAKVVGQGVYTLSKPTSTQTLQLSLKWMAASRERLRRLEKKTMSMEEKMEEIRLVNRAKWLLIDNLKMTEADAHRYIEKQAMDRCVSRREISLNIIKTYS